MNALDGLNAVTLIFVALCVFAIGYRFYGVFMADKVLKLDKERPMPSVTQADGIDYVKTNKYVLFVLPPSETYFRPSPKVFSTLRIRLPLVLT